MQTDRCTRLHQDGRTNEGSTMIVIELGKALEEYRSEHPDNQSLDAFVEHCRRVSDEPVNELPLYWTEEDFEDAFHEEGVEEPTDDQVETAISLTGSMSGWQDMATEKGAEAIARAVTSVLEAG